MHYIKSFEKYILFIFEKYVFVIIAKAVSMINNTKSKIGSNKELHKLYIQCLKIQLINLKNYSEFKNKFFQKYEKIHYKDLNEIQTNLINESLLINKNSKRPISQTIYFLDKVIFMIETQNECEDLEIISSELFKEIENFKIPGL
tara:strand:+ start:119 stop:553 length:435 start_codon:yes stop_codon:yes gene_type:complete